MWTNRLGDSRESIPSRGNSVDQIAVLIKTRFKDTFLITFLILPGRCLCLRIDSWTLSALARTARPSVTGLQSVSSFRWQKRDSEIFHWNSICSRFVQSPTLLLVLLHNHPSLMTLVEKLRDNEASANTSFGSSRPQKMAERTPGCGWSHRDGQIALCTWYYTCTVHPTRQYPHAARQSWPLCENSLCKWKSPALSPRQVHMLNHRVCTSW